jgi:hypothetical protein
MSRRLAGAALLLALGAACRRDSTEPSGPRLTVRWTGQDTVEFSARAVGEWCDSLRLLEIRAVAGDTGVGIALYPPDTLEAGAYPVRPPDVADTTRLPAAAVALRWFTQTAVMGYQGDSGGLTLERRPDGTLAGRFTAAARPLTGKGRLHLTGSFGGLRPATAPRDCAGPAVDSARIDTTQGDED